MKAESLGLLPIVTDDLRGQWEEFVLQNQDWVSTARDWEKKKEASNESFSRSRQLRGIQSSVQPIQKWTEDLSIERQLDEEGEESIDFSKGVSNRIFTFSQSGERVVDKGSGPFTPIWMTSPAPPKLATINFNLLSHQLFWQAIESAIDTQHPVLSKVFNLSLIHI